MFFGDMGYALDAATGQKLWGQKIGGAIGGGVITYTLRRFRAAGVRVRRRSALRGRQIDGCKPLSSQVLHACHPRLDR